MAEPAELDTFEFYLKFAKPLVLSLPDPNQRVLAAAWVKKLKDEANGAENVRKDYLKLLLFTLNRKRLAGPFAKNPNNETLREIQKSDELLQMAQEIILDEEVDRKKRVQSGLAGGDYPPFSAECSADMLEYAACQNIPKFGVHAYYALSKEPLTKWEHSDKALIPKGAVSPPAPEKTPAVVQKDDTIESQKGEPSSPKTCTPPPQIAEIIQSPATPKRKPDQSEQTGTPEKKPWLDGVLFGDSAGAAAEETTAQQDKSRTQSPFGLSAKEDARSPITWGSNLIDVIDKVSDVSTADSSVLINDESSVDEDDLLAMQSPLALPAPPTPAPKTPAPRTPSPKKKPKRARRGQYDDSDDEEFDEELQLPGHIAKLIRRNERYSSLSLAERRKIDMGEAETPPSPPRRQRALPPPSALSMPSPPSPDDAVSPNSRSIDAREIIEEINETVAEARQQEREDEEREAPESPLIDPYEPYKRKDMPPTPPRFSKIRKIREGPGRDKVYSPEQFGITDAEEWQSGADFQFERSPPGTAAWKPQRTAYRGPESRPVESVFPTVSRSDWDMMFFEAQQEADLIDDEDFAIGEEVTDVPAEDADKRLKKLLGDLKESAGESPAAGGVAATTPKAPASPIRLHPYGSDFPLFESEMPEFASPEPSPERHTSPEQRKSPTPERRRTPSPQKPQSPTDDFGLPYLNFERPPPPPKPPSPPKPPTPPPAKSPIRDASHLQTRVDAQYASLADTPPKKQPTPKKKTPSPEKAPIKNMDELKAVVDAQYAALYDTLIADEPPQPCGSKAKSPKKSPYVPGPFSPPPEPVVYPDDLLGVAAALPESDRTSPLLESGEIPGSLQSPMRLHNIEVEGWKTPERLKSPPRPKRQALTFDDYVPPPPPVPPGNMLALEMPPEEFSEAIMTPPTPPARMSYEEYLEMIPFDERPLDDDFILEDDATAFGPLLESHEPLEYEPRNQYSVVVGTGKRVTLPSSSRPRSRMFQNISEEPEYIFADLPDIYIPPGSPPRLKYVPMILSPDPEPEPPPKQPSPKKQPEPKPSTSGTQLKGKGKKKVLPRYMQRSRAVQAAAEERAREKAEAEERAKKLKASSSGSLRGKGTKGLKGKKGGPKTPVPPPRVPTPPPPVEAPPAVIEEAKAAEQSAFAEAMVGREISDVKMKFLQGFANEKVQTTLLRVLDIVDDVGVDEFLRDPEEVLVFPEGMADLTGERPPSPLHAMDEIESQFGPTPPRPVRSPYQEIPAFDFQGDPNDFLGTRYEPYVLPHMRPGYVPPEVTVPVSPPARTYTPPRVDVFGRVVTPERPLNYVSPVRLVGEDDDINLGEGSFEIEELRRVERLRHPGSPIATPDKKKRKDLPVRPTILDPSPPTPDFRRIQAECQLRGRAPYHDGQTNLKIGTSGSKSRVITRHMARETVPDLDTIREAPSHYRQQDLDFEQRVDRARQLYPHQQRPIYVYQGKGVAEVADSQAPGLPNVDEADEDYEPIGATPLPGGERRPKGRSRRRPNTSGKRLDFGQPNPSGSPEPAKKPWLAACPFEEGAPLPGRPVTPPQRRSPNSYTVSPINPRILEFERRIGVDPRPPLEYPDELMGHAVAIPGGMRMPTLLDIDDAPPGLEGPMRLREFEIPGWKTPERLKTPPRPPPPPPRFPDELINPMAYEDAPRDLLLLPDIPDEDDEEEDEFPLTTSLPFFTETSKESLVFYGPSPRKQLQKAQYRTNVQRGPSPQTRSLPTPSPPMPGRPAKTPSPEVILAAQQMQNLANEQYGVLMPTPSPPTPGGRARTPSPQAVAAAQNVQATAAAQYAALAGTPSPRRSPPPQTADAIAERLRDTAAAQYAALLEESPPQETTTTTITSTTSPERTVQTKVVETLTSPTRRLPSPTSAPRPPRRRIASPRPEGGRPVEMGDGTPKRVWQRPRRRALPEAQAPVSPQRLRPRQLFQDQPPGAERTPLGQMIDEPQQNVCAMRPPDILDQVPMLAPDLAAELAPIDLMPMGDPPSPYSTASNMQNFMRNVRMSSSQMTRRDIMLPSYGREPGIELPRQSGVTSEMTPPCEVDWEGGDDYVYWPGPHDPKTVDLEKFKPKHLRYLQVEDVDELQPQYVPTRMPSPSAPIDARVEQWVEGVDVPSDYVAAEYVPHVPIPYNFPEYEEPLPQGINDLDVECELFDDEMLNSPRRLQLRSPPPSPARTPIGDSPVTPPYARRTEQLRRSPPPSIPRELLRHYGTPPGTPPFRVDRFQGAGLEDSPPIELPQSPMSLHELIESTKIIQDPEGFEKTIFESEINLLSKDFRPEKRRSYKVIKERPTLRGLRERPEPGQTPSPPRRQSPQGYGPSPRPSPWADSPQIRTPPPQFKLDIESPPPLQFPERYVRFVPPPSKAEEEREHLVEMAKYNYDQGIMMTSPPGMAEEQVEDQFVMMAAEQEEGLFEGDMEIPELPDVENVQVDPFRSRVERHRIHMDFYDPDREMQMSKRVITGKGQYEIPRHAPAPTEATIQESDEYNTYYDVPQRPAGYRTPVQYQTTAQLEDVVAAQYASLGNTTPRNYDVQPRPESFKSPYATPPRSYDVPPRPESFMSPYATPPRTYDVPTRPRHYVSPYELQLGGQTPSPIPRYHNVEQRPQDYNTPPMQQYMEEELVCEGGSPVYQRSVRIDSPGQDDDYPIDGFDAMPMFGGNYDTELLDTSLIPEYCENDAAGGPFAWAD